jgi:hypothetical protein
MLVIQGDKEVSDVSVGFFVGDVDVFFHGVFGLVIDEGLARRMNGCKVEKLGLDGY